jgi:uncharacterized protein (DUF1501 family)
MEPLMPSRRIFLKANGCALLALGLAPDFLLRAAAAGTTRRRVLVVVFQRGAVDGLNMVVPFGERAYYAARPSIAIQPPGREGGALDLDGFFGLHPRMSPLAPCYRDGSLAIVHASGSPDGTRSHFDAQDYMESGTPGQKSTRDGWLNRYLHAAEHAAATSFRAVAVTPQLPRTLQGRAPALAMNRVDRFGLRQGSWGAATSFEAQYAEAADVVLNRTGREAFDAMRLLRANRPDAYRPTAGVAYPRSPFGRALEQVAQLVKADVGLEVAFAETGGWDHHVNQGADTGQLATRLDDFARAIGAFAADLGSRMADIVLVTMSEFGRAVSENGNRGTDHGHGNAMLVLGGGVKGGTVYGRWPGLSVEQRHERRDLAVTTDFRQVLAELLEGHLGLDDAGAVFPGFVPGRGARVGLL